MIATVSGPVYFYIVIFFQSEEVPFVWLPENKHRNYITIVTDYRNGQGGVYGTGVFAKDYFKPGDSIERASLVMPDVTERETLQNTVLFGYF